MYCKNCGNEMDDKAVVCTKCGYAKGNGDRYCINCGTEIPLGASVCMQCGFSTQGNKDMSEIGTKSRILAGILGIVFGFLGVHNFYLGYTTKGIIQLCLTIGSFVITLMTCFILWFIIPLVVSAVWIWGGIEGILILTKKINVDGKGNALGE